jgi:hypothetical protein
MNRTRACPERSSFWHLLVPSALLHLQEEKTQLERDAATAAEASTAERDALTQQLEAKTAELEAACGTAEATAAQLAEAAEARDRAQQECTEHAEYQESLEGVVQRDSVFVVSCGPQAHATPAGAMTASKGAGVLCRCCFSPRLSASDSFCCVSGTLNERELEVAGLRAQLEEATGRLSVLDAQLSESGAATDAAAAQRDQLSADVTALRCTAWCMAHCLSCKSLQRCAMTARLVNSHGWVLNLASIWCRAELAEVQHREQASAQQAAQLSADVEALQVRCVCLTACSASGCDAPAARHQAALLAVSMFLSAFSRPDSGATSVVQQHIEEARERRAKVQEEMEQQHQTAVDSANAWKAAAVSTQRSDCAAVSACLLLRIC